MSAFGATPAATTSAFGTQAARMYLFVSAQLDKLTSNLPPATAAFGGAANTGTGFNARPSAFGSSAFGSSKPFKD